MDLLQINPYEVNSFKRDPRTRATAEQIYKAFGPVNLDFLPWFSNDHKERPRARQYSYIYDYRIDLDTRENYLFSITNRLFNISLFYYIEYLKELNPDRIVDIGCANNLLKKVCNKIHGISNNPNNVNADEYDSFGPEFIEKYRDQLQCAMAICSLHYISLVNLNQRILDFASVIAPGGRGLLTLNVLRMVEMTSPEEFNQLFQTTQPSKQQLAVYVDQVIRSIPLKFLVVENLIEKVDDEPINGNIRLVFEK